MEFRNFSRWVGVEKADILTCSICGRRYGAGERQQWNVSGAPSTATQSGPLAFGPRPNWPVSMLSPIRTLSGRGNDIHLRCNHRLGVASGDGGGKRKTMDGPSHQCPRAS